MRSPTLLTLRNLLYRFVSLSSIFEKSPWCKNDGENFATAQLGGDFTQQKFGGSR